MTILLPSIPLPSTRLGSISLPSIVASLGAEVETRESAICVVGSGIAGLTAALKLAPLPVVVLTKGAEPAGGSSLHAQGGVAAAVGEDDRPEWHAEDTVAAGAGLVDTAIATLLAREGADQVRSLIADGVPFDRKPDGQPQLGREAAHRCPRVLHGGGDATGRMLVQALIDRFLRTPSITLQTGCFAVDLVTDGDRVHGVLARQGGRWILYRAPAVILATGGIGAAYARTTNPPESTGDGLAMAARAGATLADLEFVQFHPTALMVPGGGGSQAPLLTEALRGAGAVLVDRTGRPIMAGEHPMGDLAPRDVVARALWRRVAAGDSVFLDLRPALASKPDGFPTALELCAAAGIDPGCGPVPIAPAAHYHMGGVRTDAVGRTSLAGLWACGEVACTGVHGANRLASNSLLEALVFGDRVAADIGARLPAPTAAAAVMPALPPLPAGDAVEALQAIMAETRSRLYEDAGVVRDGLRLVRLRHHLERLEGDLATCCAARAGGEAGAGNKSERHGGCAAAVDDVTVRAWGEARNMLLVGRLIAHAALTRAESRGAHYRADHPQTAAVAHRQAFRIDAAAHVLNLARELACCLP